MRDSERDDEAKGPPLRPRRALMAVAALVACVLCGIPAASIHQNAGGPLALGPVPPVAPVLLPADPTTADAALPPAMAVPNTVPLSPAGSLVVPPVVVPPVAVVVPVPTGPVGSYGFEVSNPDGSPVRWNPCVAVHYLVNLSSAPPGALADLQHAVAIVSQSTGLEFVYDGTSAAGLETSWIPSGPVGASGWPDVLIGWSDPHHTDLNLTAGMGGITQYEAASLAGGGDALVGAVVVLSAPNDPGPGFGPNARGALLLHELGHAVGLAHVDDRTQIMNPVSTGAAGVYGTGDLAGLRILGSGGCLAVPTRSETNLHTGRP